MDPCPFQNETQTALSRFWTRIADFILYVDNRYSKYIYTLGGVFMV